MFLNLFYSFQCFTTSFVDVIRLTLSNFSTNVLSDLSCIATFSVPRSPSTLAYPATMNDAATAARIAPRPTMPDWRVNPWFAPDVESAELPATYLGQWKEEKAANCRNKEMI